MTCDCCRGACCTPEGCEVTLASECTGCWRGPGTNCDNDPCAGACCYAYAHSAPDPAVGEPPLTTTESCEECYRECVEETYPASEAPDENGDCPAGYTLVDGYCYQQCPEGFTLEGLPGGVCRKRTQVPLSGEGCEGQLAGVCYGPCGEWLPRDQEPCECVNYGCDCEYPGPNAECSENFYEEGSSTSPFLLAGDRRRLINRRKWYAGMDYIFYSYAPPDPLGIAMQGVTGAPLPWTFLWKTTPAALQGRQFFFVWDRAIAYDDEVTGWNPPAGYGGVPGDNPLYVVSDHWTITRERLRFYVVECIGETQQIRDATGEYVDLFYNGDPYDGSVLETASGDKYDSVAGCDSFNPCPPTTAQPDGAEFCTDSFTLDCPPAPLSLFAKAKNFAKSAARHLALGMPAASPEEIDRRYSICQGCEFLKNNSCLKCGCPITRDKKFISKLSWANESCPVGKWGNGK